MSTDLKRRNVPFSPPDMTEAEANEVRDTILSGWITTGPRTKKLEKLISEYVGTEKTVCLNSATAAMEMVLHVLGVGSGDEVIMPAYTYTASASVVDHVGATIKMVDIRKAGSSDEDQDFEMDYEKLAEAIKGTSSDPASYQIALKYIETLKEMTSGKDNKTVYIPYEATSLLGSLGGIKDILKG